VASATHQDGIDVGFSHHAVIVCRGVHRVAFAPDPSHSRPPSDGLKPAGHGFRDELTATRPMSAIATGAELSPKAAVEISLIGHGNATAVGLSGTNQSSPKL